MATETTVWEAWEALGKAVEECFAAMSLEQLEFMAHEAKFNAFMMTVASTVLAGREDEEVS